jgi:hypothetical protein
LDEMDGMYPLMGLALAREIQHDHVVAAEQHRAARQARTPLLTRISRQARAWKPAPVLQVGRARATAPSAPMGCTA